MLCSGGLAKAIAMFTGSFEPPVIVNDFAIGYSVNYTDKNGIKKAETLIEFGSKIPATGTLDLKDIQSFSVGIRL